MNKSSHSAAPANRRTAFAPTSARRCRLGPAVIIAMAAAAAGAAVARPSCAQSLPAAWVADERTAPDRREQTFTERTPADPRPAGTAVWADGRGDAAYSPPPAPSGMRPQRIDLPGNARRPDVPGDAPNVSGAGVVPIAYSAEAPALAPEPTSNSAEAARSARPVDPAQSAAHPATTVPLSPPRPAAPFETPSLESQRAERATERGNPMETNADVGPGDRQPTMLPAPNGKPLPGPVSLSPHRQSETEGRGSSVRALGTIAGSLAIVLTLLFVALWLLRRTSPAAAQPLPVEVVEVLGRAPLSGRQQMHLLRCGRKLLLVSVTPECAKTLTEITDPLEVDRLAGLCQQSRPNSATAAFRRVFEQFATARPEA